MKMMHKRNNEFRRLVDKLYGALEMERRIIGIELLRTDAAYQGTEARELTGKINYCQMIAAASRGNAIKSDRHHIKCVSGIRALGFDHTDTVNSQGENWIRLGMYEDQEVSRKLRQRIDFIPEGTCGVLLQPLEDYAEMPDVIMIVTTPYNIMRITQGYAYRHGQPEHLNIAGNQAICLECTAAPYTADEMNVSTLCIGTRHQAGWKDTEMAVGIPRSKFADTVEGVMATINIMESDAKKEQIEKRMKAAGIEMPEIRYHYNYYLDC